MDQVERELDTLDKLRVRQRVLAILGDLAAEGDTEVAGRVAQEKRLDGHTVLAVTGEGLRVGEELLGRVRGRRRGEAGLLEHLTVVVQDVGLGVIGQRQDLAIDRHALHHRSVVVRGLDAGFLHVGVERLENSGQLLCTRGLRGQDAGRVTGDHPSLDLGPIVVEGGTVEGQREVRIRLLGRIHEGLPLSTVVFRRDPGVHLVDLVATGSAGRSASRGARACEERQGRGRGTECEELGVSGAHGALLPTRGTRHRQPTCAASL